MSDNMNRVYDEERSINLIDMILYLLKQWRTLIMVLVIGAILGMGIYWIKKPKESEVSVAESIEDVEEKYDLDADVKENMELAYKYRQLYASQIKYDKNSILMQMDPNSVYKGMLEYYIEAGSNTRLIGEFFQNILNDESLLADIKIAGDLECDPQFVQEILECDLKQEDYQVINVQENDNGGHNLIVSYSVEYIDKESCDKMMEVIADRVDALNQKLQEQYGVYTFVKTNDTVQMSINNDIFKSQKTNADTVKSYLDNITKLENTFEKDDLEYYQAVYLSREIEDEEDEAIKEKVSENLKSSPMDAVKWIIIGMLLAGVCWGGYYVLKYVLDRNIKSVKELSHISGVQLLGTIEVPGKRKNKVDEFVSRLYRINRGSANSIGFISTVINALKLEKLLICLDLENEKLQIVASDLAGQCKNLSIQNMIHCNAEAFNAAMEADGIILMALVGVTGYEEVQRELEICRLQKILVAGIIAVDAV